jgi:hypothetical protein
MHLLIKQFSDCVVVTISIQEFDMLQEFEIQILGLSDSVVAQKRLIFLLVKVIIRKKSRKPVSILREKLTHEAYQTSRCLPYHRRAFELILHWYHSLTLERSTTRKPTKVTQIQNVTFCPHSFHFTSLKYQPSHPPQQHTKANRKPCASIPTHYHTTK